MQDLVKYASRAAALALVSTLVACGGGSTGPTQTTLPPAQPTPAPTPVATPVPVPTSVSGFWLARTGNLAGYGIEVTQSGNTFRGRAVFPFRNVTGPTVGSLNGATVRYDTDYGAGDTDSFDGALDASRTRMTGTVAFQLRSIGYVVTFSDVTLERQP
ncbi:MAG: hypothetical protein ABW221_26985 [Vicinamibacteria bacterium]